ncbi:hypothetical protein M7I_5471 [Glarea lozoyensis 74030]|nr:hypothetical protein M7I_5471 [Glarea lozoyensis 74030]
MNILADLFRQRFGKSIDQMQMHEITQNAGYGRNTYTRWCRRFVEYLRENEGGKQYVSPELEAKLFPADTKHEEKGSLYARKDTKQYEISNQEALRTAEEMNPYREIQSLFPALCNKRWTVPEWECLRDVMAVEPLGTKKGVAMLMKYYEEVDCPEEQLAEYWKVNKHRIWDHFSIARPGRFNAKWHIERQKHAWEFGSEEWDTGAAVEDSFYSKDRLEQIRQSKAAGGS